eukprot:3523505-Pyramimonas_sp.AAC.1
MVDSLKPNQVASAIAHITSRVLIGPVHFKRHVVVILGEIRRAVLNLVALDGLQKPSNPTRSMASKPTCLYLVSSPTES